MQSVVSFFRTFSFRLLRDKFACFWLLIFPMLILGILILIFGNLTGDQFSFNSQVALIDDDQEEISSILTGVLEEIAEAENGWLQLNSYQDLEEARAGLGAGTYQAIFRIPPGFSREIMDNVSGQFRGQEVLPAGIEFYFREGEQSSEVTVTALNQVVEVFTGELYLETGLMLPAQRITAHSQMVEVRTEEGVSFNYVNYIIPGIILMAFLSTGMEELVTNLTVPRDRGILRRFFATPLQAFQYTGGLILYIVVIAAVQLLIIYWFGRWAFSAQIDLWSPLPLFFTLYSLLVLMGVGLLIATLARNASAAGRLVNIVFYPMMFLGGLYFPLEGMPGFIRLVTAINPVTYLINGLRESLGVFPSSTSLELNLLVPGIWLMAGLILGLKKFKWEAGQ